MVRLSECSTCARLDLSEAFGMNKVRKCRAIADESKLVKIRVIWGTILRGVE